ncbi:uncharacterized protein LOC133737777 [Rosa rugosa]|uniref:uncharacterized protein LOC133737777 n=1 Tax=Rosa rugosa TaxID=74645 RepID=UPI002B406204|nr:uncharacterized protein LOC133737777 [Rosa rugosa]
MAQALVTGKEGDQTNIHRGKGSTDPENPEPKGGNPGHYNACFDYVKLLSKAMLIVLGLGMATFPSYGTTEIQKIRNKKEKHKWAVQIMDKLLESALMYEYEDSGGMNPQAATTDETRPYKISDGGHHITLGDIQVPEGVIGEGSLQPEMTQNKTPEMEKTETPILIASKNGVIEMVEKILELFPTAIHDVDSKDKNIVLLAVENKQTNVYQLLLNSGHLMKDREFGKVDIDWNSALHLAARLGNNKPWLIVGPALQIQWEVKWFEYVKNSMAAHSFFRYNRDNKTAEDIFTESHSELVQEGVKWLSKTSESCSLIASLVATVSFATETTIPGGIKDESGRPILANQPAF